LRTRTQFKYAPNEGSGGGELPDVVKLADGTEISSEDALKQLNNYSNLQTNYTQGQQDLAKVQGQVTEQGRQIDALSRKPASTPPPRAVTVDFNAQHKILDDKMKALDINTSDNYTTEVVEIEQARRELNAQERAADKTAAKAELDASERRSGNRARSADQQVEMDRKNESTFASTLDEVAEREGITFTDAEKTALRQRFLSHVGPGIYGTYHDGIRKFEYNSDAVVAAIRGENGIYDRIIAKQRSEGRDEGLRLHVTQRDSGDSSPGAPTSSPPAEGADHYADTAVWLRTQSPDVQRNYISTHREFGSWYEGARREAHQNAQR